MLKRAFHRFRGVTTEAAAAFRMMFPMSSLVLEQVLRRLRDGSRGRSVRLYTYGPCTRQVARQRWLDRLDPNGDRVDRLAAFRTLE